MDTTKTYESSFTDVSSDMWYANVVGYMEQYNLISGYTDGTFGGSKAITRAEFATIASKLDTLSDGENIFDDVTDNHWASDYIVSAATKGWVSGYPDGSFMPNANITRAEAVTIVNNMLNRTADEAYIAKHSDDILCFEDVADTHWAYFNILEASNGQKYDRDDSGELWLEKE